MREIIMGEVVSMRNATIKKIVQELKRQYSDTPEIAEALGNLMKDGKVDYVRRDGEWAFFLSTKDY
jgi:hypothetical protein